MARPSPERWQGVRPSFCCVLAHTDTCLIPGLRRRASAKSCARSPRRPTPRSSRSARRAACRSLPSNPLGAPGPAGITRAALQLAGIEAHVRRRRPARVAGHPVLRVSEHAGRQHRAGLRRPGRARAVRGRLRPRSRALRQWRDVPRRSAKACRVARPPPWRCCWRWATRPRAASAAASAGQRARAEDARGAVRALAEPPASARATAEPDPLRAVATLGDPMQPWSPAWCWVRSQRRRDVLLAGGSQMLAVAALCGAGRPGGARPGSHRHHALGRPGPGGRRRRPGAPRLTRPARAGGQSRFLGVAPCGAARLRAVSGQGGRRRRRRVHRGAAGDRCVDRAARRRDRRCVRRPSR